NSRAVTAMTVSSPPVQTGTQPSLFLAHINSPQANGSFAFGEEGWVLGIWAKANRLDLGTMVQTRHQFSSLQAPKSRGLILASGQKIFAIATETDRSDIPVMD